jgi:hypothetical protein
MRRMLYKDVGVRLLCKEDATVFEEVAIQGSCHMRKLLFKEDGA